MSATRERARIVAALRNWAKIADDPDFAAYAQDAKSAIAFASMIEEGIGSFAWPAEPKPKFYSRTPDEGYGAFAEHDSAEAAQTTARDALEPDGEWPEDIEETQWGILIPIECAQQVDYEETGGGEFDYTCRYELATATEAK
jgi:hypothetical protein